EIYDVHVHSALFSQDAVVANIGFAVQLQRDTWLGIAYHTPPGLAVQNSLDGDMDVQLQPRFDPGVTIHGGATVNISQPASVDVELRTRLLQLLELHVGGHWEDLSRFRAFD